MRFLALEFESMNFAACQGKTNKNKKQTNPSCLLQSHHFISELFRDNLTGVVTLCRHHHLSGFLNSALVIYLEPRFGKGEKENAP